MRVGTRKSKLAHEQVRMFSSRLKEEIEIVDVSTEGDTNRNISINEFGSQGVFVNALNRKVLDGEVDCAVHSAKDLPSEIDPDLSITALFDWEHFHDIFIGVDRNDAVVGTSSPRRVSQIAYYGKKWIARDIRGNIDTRMDKVKRGEYDGIILSEAGIRRLYPDMKFMQLPYDVFVPAPTQGIICVVTRKDSEFHDKINKIDQYESRKRWNLERRTAITLEIGCSSSTGIFYHPLTGMLHIYHELQGNVICRKFRAQTEQDAEDAGNNIRRDST